MGGPIVLGVDLQRPSAAVVAEVARRLAMGDIVAFPTDTLYGLHADTRVREALERLARVKRHERPRPFVLLFGGSDAELDVLAPARTHVARSLADRYWPGPLTLVLTSGPEAPTAAIAPNGTIALRAPADALSRAIVGLLGAPIASTSANRAGETPARGADAIVDRFGADVPLVVDGGRIEGGEASTIVDATMDRARLVRAGGLRVDLDADERRGL